MSFSQASDAEIDALVKEYEAQYVVAADLRVGGARHSSVREAARIEIGLRNFLTEGDFKGYTDTFEDLHGMAQLPGLPSQRMMADGHGFGGEGDWKTAALVRAMKVMASGLEGGTSFMEDYTYHLNPSGQKVLGAHMLEICPSIAEGPVNLEVHPLGIGGKADPARLVFNSQTGPAINVSLMDMGNRFRMVVNDVDVIPPDEPLPKLPVARALWIPQPNLKGGGSGLDLRGWRASYWFQPVPNRRASERFRGDGRDRISAHQQRHADSPVQAGTALERCLLSAGTADLIL